MGKYSRNILRPQKSGKKMGSRDIRRGSPSGHAVLRQVQQPPPQQAPPDGAGSGEANPEACDEPARVTATAVNTRLVSA